MEHLKTCSKIVQSRVPSETKLHGVICCKVEKRRSVVCKGTAAIEGGQFFRNRSVKTGEAAANRRQSRPDTIFAFVFNPSVAPRQFRLRGPMAHNRVSQRDDRVPTNKPGVTGEIGLVCWILSWGWVGQPINGIHRRHTSASLASLLFARNKSTLRWKDKKKRKKNRK